MFDAFSHKMNISACVNKSTGGNSHYPCWTKKKENNKKNAPPRNTVTPTKLRESRDQHVCRRMFGFSIHLHHLFVFVRVDSFRKLVCFEM